MVYGCDVCQDVCPWNHGVERRLDGAQLSADAAPVISLRDWLERDGAELVAEFDRLYVPKNDPRWLRRNALIAAGNVGTDEIAPVVDAYASDDDPVLAEVARWARDRIRARVVTARVDRELLALLVHEVRSSVAALSAIAEAVSSGGIDDATLRRLVALSVSACRGIERVVEDTAPGSVRLEEVDVGRRSARRCRRGVARRSARSRGRRVGAARDPRGSCEAAPGTRQPDCERRARTRRRRTRSSWLRTRAGRSCSCPSEMRVRGYRASSRSGSSSPGSVSSEIARDRASASRSRERLRRRTGAGSRSSPTPGHGATFTIALPLRQT